MKYKKFISLLSVLCIAAPSAALASACGLELPKLNFTESDLMAFYKHGTVANPETLSDVTDGGVVTDKSFNQQGWQSIEDMRDNLLSSSAASKNSTLSYDTNRKFKSYYYQPTDATNIRQSYWAALSVSKTIVAVGFNHVQPFNTEWTERGTRVKDLRAVLEDVTPETYPGSGVTNISYGANRVDTLGFHGEVSGFEAGILGMMHVLAHYNDKDGGTKSLLKRATSPDQDGNNYRHFNVATFGGMDIPPVVFYMFGLREAVNYFNKILWPMIYAQASGKQVTDANFSRWNITKISDYPSPTIVNNKFVTTFGKNASELATLIYNKVLNKNSGDFAAATTQDIKTGIENTAGYSGNSSEFNPFFCWTGNQGTGTANADTSAFSGNFIQGRGAPMATSFAAANAALIFPVAGPQTQDVLNVLKSTSTSNYVKNNTKVIGVDVDQTKQFSGGDGQKIITSALKRIEPAIYAALMALYRPWKDNLNRNIPYGYYYKYKNDGVTKADKYNGGNNPSKNPDKSNLYQFWKVTKGKVQYQGGNLPFNYSGVAPGSMNTGINKNYDGLYYRDYVDFLNSNWSKTPTNNVSKPIPNDTVVTLLSKWWNYLLGAGTPKSPAWMWSVRSYKTQISDPTTWTDLKVE